ncbi:hypothetical protein [Nonomuraea helvata]|uniref:Uncharacterized protein n=1 Tax=Nonomuraea helvata TaxID=37484 RepID=A0ABV5SF29_9ACTN
MKNLLVMATAGALLAIPTGTAQATASTEVSTQAGSTDVSMQDVHRASIDCSRPKGKTTNYSWGDGATSVTVYFNNHCSHRVSAKLHIKSAFGDYTKCLRTNGGTEGRKKFDIGLAGTLTGISKGC